MQIPDTQWNELMQSIDKITDFIRKTENHLQTDTPLMQIYETTIREEYLLIMIQGIEINIASHENGTAILFRTKSEAFCYALEQHPNQTIKESGNNNTAFTLQKGKIKTRCRILPVKTKCIE